MDMVTPVGQEDVYGVSEVSRLHTLTTVTHTVRSCDGRTTVDGVGRTKDGHGHGSPEVSGHDTVGHTRDTWERNTVTSVDSRLTTEVKTHVDGRSIPRGITGS